MKRIMIYHTQIPDLATSKNERGEIEYLGSIQGKTCTIPVVDCPIHGTRIPLQACLECPHDIAVQTHFVECVSDSNILGKSNTPQKIQEIEQETHPTMTNRAEPNGVYRPKNK